MTNIYNYSKTALLLIFIVLVQSCNTEDNYQTDKNIENEITLKSNYKALNFTPNIYHDFFKATENGMEISALKFGEDGLYSAVNNYSIDNPSATKIRLNGQILDYSQHNINNDTSLDYYGKTLNLSIENQNPNYQARSTEDSNIEVYIPELIEITNPKKRVGTENSPLVDANNFVVEWNADPNNEEGLVVLAEYLGTCAVPGNNSNEYILNADYIELDNGYFKLNPSIFEGMPNLAFVQIILLRGNIVIEEIEGELYKFIFESHHRLPIILVKDATQIGVNN